MSCAFLPDLQQWEVSKIKKVWNLFEKNFERVLVTMLFIFVILTVLMQILCRWFLPNPPIWTEELARYFFIWMVFLSFSYSVKNREDLCLDIVSRHFKRKLSNVFTLFIDILALAVFVFIAYWGFKYIDFTKLNLAPALQISLGLVYCVTPISMVLCVIRAIALIVEDIKRILGKLPEEVAEEV